MRLLSEWLWGKGPILTDSKGNQRVLALISNELDNYVVFYDTLQDSTYIERVINRWENAFQSSNLVAIKSEEEYSAILTFCVDKEIIKVF